MHRAVETLVAVFLPVACVALPLAGTASCFNPSPVTGAACAPNNECPPGLECTGGTCELPGPLPDDAAPSCSWRSAHLAPCEFPAADGDLVIETLTTFDTDTFEFINPMGGGQIPAGVEVLNLDIAGLSVALVVAQTVIVEPFAVLRVTGSKPVVFAAYQSIRIEGSIELSSGSDGGIPFRGAGSSPSNCVANATSQAVGGAGGSQTDNLGGGGGASSLGDAKSMPSLPSGTPVLQGGCDGVSGGRGSDLNGGMDGPGGVGGEGGGAIYLTAAVLIEIDGGLEAGGGGGAGAGSGSGSGMAAPGGGGGGAGGHIVLESPQIRFINAFVLANGGGAGGGGGPMSSGGLGQPAGELGGAGGSGSDMDGGQGGQGGDDSVPGCSGRPGSDALDGGQGGGGGGGGSCGRIDAFTDMLDEIGTNVLSPLLFLSGLPE